MEIIHRHGLAFKVIEEIVPPYDRPRLVQSKVTNDILCEDLTSLYSDPNSRSIVLLTDNPTKPIMTYQDILDEIDYIKRSRFRSGTEDLRNELISYYQKVSDTMRAYKREEQINKVLNSNECILYLAC
jgi:hypothetical protein